MMNDKTELVKEAKNDKASRCCWSAYQKKRLGEMGLSEMLPNPEEDTHSCWRSACSSVRTTHCLIFTRDSRMLRAS